MLSCTAATITIIATSAFSTAIAIAIVMRIGREVLSCTAADITIIATLAFSTAITIAIVFADSCRVLY